MSNMTNTINVYGDATGILIQQGNNDSTQIQEYTLMTESEMEKYQAVLNQIRKYQDHFNDEFGEKSAELMETLDKAQEALNKKDESLWKKALSVIKDIAIGATGSLIATGIIGLITPML